MKRLFVLVSLGLAACAHLPGRATPAPPASMAVWHEAHMALYLERFALADSLFSRLWAEHPDSDEGREALFYVGTLQLDPRNRDWNSERAETALQRYLLQDTIGTLIHRRPEAITLLELARQLNLPPEARVPALAPETPPISPTTRRVVPAAQQQEMTEEIERLRRQLLQRDEQIRRQRDELDRIRRTLTPRTP